MKVVPTLALALLLPMIAFAKSAPPPPPDHSKLDAVLSDVVKGESVDYDLLGTRHRLELFNYLAKMAEIEPMTLPREERLAYYINVYNAYVLHEVVGRRANDPAWRADANAFALFDDPVVTIRGRRLSLNDLEHRIIRPSFNDPRVHAALVCAARSCPPLLNRAYTGRNVQPLLELNMRRFLEDRTRNPIDEANKQLRLSKIFEWYAGDFGGRDKLAEYVGGVLGKDFDGYTVSFVEYSWELNDVKR